MELNNITILITILGIVSVVGLIVGNEMIVTTVIGGLIGYLSKDVNIHLGTDDQKKNETSTSSSSTDAYTLNSSTLTVTPKDNDGDDVA